MWFGGGAVTAEVTSAITAPPPNHTDRDARTTRDSPPPIRSTSTRPSPRHTDRDARTPRERMAECRVSPGKTHVLIGDSVFGQIRPELMYPHKAQQKISISGLTVDDLLHWLQNVPKCRDVQLLVVHVGVNTVTESMWGALLKLLKSVFPNAVVHLSSLIPPQGEHSLRKTVAASNAALVKACHSEQVMLADHTDTFTTNSGAPRKALYRDALHPSPKGTVRLACNVKYMYVGQPRPPLRPQERPSHPSPSASGRMPLLETPSFQPRFDCPPSQHLRALFQSLSVCLSVWWEEPAVQKWASCFNHSRSFPTTSTATTTACGHGKLHPTTTAWWRPTTPSASPLQQRNTPTPWCRHRSATLQWLVRSTSTPSPQVGRATAAVQLWSSPATWTSVYSPPFLQHTASQHRPAPPSHQLLGWCSGDTCVTQACSVCPAVCFNGSLFLYTPDWCVLVAWMRACGVNACVCGRACARSCTRTTYSSWYECVTLNL